MLARPAPNVCELYCNAANWIFKDAVLSALATIGKQDRTRLSERTIAGSRRRASRGAWGPAAADRKLGRDGILNSERLTMAEIGEQLGISAASVCRMLKAYRMQRVIYVI